MAEKRKKYMRVFILESPDPLDILKGTAEGPGLKELIKLIGHESEVFHIISKNDLEKIMKFISSIEEKTKGENSKPSPDICIHISAHGNEDGLWIGGDFVNWKQLLKSLQHILSEDFHYTGKRIIVLSACLAENQGLTKYINKIVKNEDHGLIPPEYIFTTSGKIPWDSAAVGWAIFYHLLPNADFENKDTIKNILKSIAEINVGNIKYFRYDHQKKKYVSYPKEKQ